MAKRKAPKKKSAARKKASRVKSTRPRGKSVRKSLSKKRAAPARKARKPARAAKPARRAAKPARRATKPSRQGARPKPAALQRERRRLTESDMVPTPPSTLDFQRGSSAAASGRESIRQHKREHTEGGAALTGGDVDADWGEAAAEGDEAPGGDNPTPDQDVVEEIGRALGVEYDDAEELKGAEKIEERDKHRWEYDPASAEDYKDRNRKQ